MATQGEASEERISEFDDDFVSQLSALLGVDAHQVLKRQEEEDHTLQMKMKKDFNPQMRSEAKRLKTFVTYDTFRSWTPQEMAAAGFYYTRVKLGVQCFCCSLILFCTRLRNLPIESHKRWHPDCAFLLGKDVGNIGKYDIRVKSPEKLRGGKARYQEEARLESFENWLFYAHGTSPRVLSAAGFVFTGRTFCEFLGQKRITYGVSCVFLQNLKSSAEVSPALQSHCALPEAMDSTGESNHGDPSAVHSTMADLAQRETQWFQEAKSLSEQLRRAYTKATFRHMDLPEVCSSLGTDHLLGCDLFIISKHISRPVQEAMMLPEVFTNLSSVMCVEGETGSGKTTFLKKTAFLWASGCCPLLNRFQLVFYISLRSTRPDQGLADIIGAQLLEAGGCVSDVCLSSSIQQLRHRHKAMPEPLRATVSLCGQLALRGLFSSCFEFSSEDLTEAGVDEDEDLTTCLMSKFTAQRLSPVYRFLSPLFQEFLAAMRLTELLSSERKEDQDLGLDYLRQINSPLKAMSVYNNFLKYVSSHPSSKAAPMVVSHLLQLVDDKESLENMSEDEDYGKLHQKTPQLMKLIKDMWQVYPEAFSSFISEHLLSIALNIAYVSNTVAACSPIISQFLRGRTLALNVLNFQYFEDHPESLLLLRSVNVSINGHKMPPRVFSYSVMEKCFESLQPPTVDEDYAPAFEHMKEWEKNLAENEDNVRNFMNSQPLHPPNISAGYWKLSPKHYKIPRLEVAVANMDPADQALLQFLMEVFSASQNIELLLNHSNSFLESIRLALELHKSSVTKCSMCGLELSTAEQELLLTLPALQTLEVSGKKQLPVKLIQNSPNLHVFRLKDTVFLDFESLMTALASCKKLREIEFSGRRFETMPFDQLFSNLDKFPNLKELSVRLTGKPDVLSVIPGDFPNLHHMEKLCIETSTESDISKLVKLIQNSPNLHVFCLKDTFFSDFESLVTVLASCKKLREIEFSGGCFETMPFVNILPKFVSLKVLNLTCQQIPDKETSETFAQALGSLRNLEELFLPTGDGIQQVARLIVRQCLQLQCLRVLAFHHTLDDDSVMEIAKGVTSGAFQKLETLDLSVNHKITEEGYRNFFQTLDNLPNLQVLNICRSLPERIQVQATTVKALSQCVSRLPSLTRLELLSWLLDEEDLRVINAVKERHPQSKRLTVLWKWIVPFSPVIQK
ncbi:Baculoviral IAP repeat-containing protein 1a [Microtus ochrogaster]|uniref:Baculoviral IAP repeat-containing protein 1a n=1 Tax=Microtus ochrogaster TaxID=79684 RepID=A0A8J6KJR5_MICOH|nr:Baculoviral IAP repeat-containing protein 1a [Microtus ochrogaster]